jgi:hypothetical protein
MRLIHPLQITRSEKLNLGEHFFLRASLLCVSYRIPVIETKVVMGMPAAFLNRFFSKIVAVESPITGKSRLAVFLQSTIN